MFHGVMMIRLIIPSSVTIRAGLNLRIDMMSCTVISLILILLCSIGTSVAPSRMPLLSLQSSQLLGLLTSLSLISLTLMIIILSMLLLKWKHFDLSSLLNRSNMAFFNYRNRARVKDSGSILKFTSESLINPLYKPKTLGELKAEMEHTGINPAPVQMRSGIPNIKGIDPMEMPSVVVGGDPFENMRKSASLEQKLKETEEEYERTKPKPKVDPTTDPTEDSQAE